VRCRLPEGISLSCGESSCDQGVSYAGGCRCDGGQPKNFLRPCVLLLLSEQSAHGYDLMERLKEFGFSRDPGGLYRVLRSLEREAQVTSHWEASGAGPDRCLYTVTPLGRDWLAAWADTLAETKRTLDSYQRRYSAIVAAEGGDPSTPASGGTPGSPITLDDVAGFTAIVQTTRSQTSGRS